MIIIIQLVSCISPYISTLAYVSPYISTLACVSPYVAGLSKHMNKKLPIPGIEPMML